MGQYLLNNCIARLSTAVGTGGLSVNVRAGEGAQFEGAGALSTTNYLIAALIKTSGYREIAWEIVKITGRSTDTLTIVRAQEGTTALTFAAGDVIEVRPTAGAMAVLNRAQTWAGAQTFSGGATATNIREVVTANRVYYVRTDGSDSNTGLANTAGGAFLTLQKAWDVLSALDLGTYTGTINVADGTYTAGLAVNKMPVGGSGTFLTGNTTTPANVVISVAGTPVNVTVPATLSIDGVKLTTSGSGQSLVLVNHPGAVIAVGRNEYGACSNGHHLNVLAGYLTRIASGHTYTISSTTSQTHINTASNAAKVNIATQTVTLSGTPAFTTAFVNSSEASTVTLQSNTYSGSATGKRYNVTLNAVVNSYGATLPGDVAGTYATGGQYA